MAISLSVVLTSCSDANEYEETNTNNPKLGNIHPDSLSGTTWVRAVGFKKNAMGQEVQGFVDTLKFVSADSVYVKMSEGATKGTWNDDSNTAALPYYEYTYAKASGAIEILKRTVNDKKDVSKTAIFIGQAATGKKDVIVIAHYGDTPVQTYLTKQ